MTRRISPAPLAAVIIAWSAAAASVHADDGKTYKVFIFAGQSNAQGKIDTKTLEAQVNDPATRDLYKHLRKDDQWLVRDDVFCIYQGNKRGPLTIGYGSAGRTGSELEMGWVLGDAIEEPIVIVKTCQGGKSLFKPFRPPSSGLPSEEQLQKELEGAQKQAQARKQPEPTMAEIKNGYGEFYRLMFEDLRELSSRWDREFPPLKDGDDKWYGSQLKDWDQEFPVLAGRKPVLAGLIWFQGWNDQYGGADAEYETNMKNFINDVRRDLGEPKLPVVIVAMGQNGSVPAAGPMLTIRDAQMAMAELPQFKGNVKSFRSDLLVDKDAERTFENRKQNPDEFSKYGSDAAYHYFGSPIWYSRIGRAAGEAMLELLKEQGKSGPVKAQIEASGK